LLHQSRHLFPASLVPSSASLFALSLSLSLCLSRKHTSAPELTQCRERRALFFFSSQSLFSFWQCK
jgi:hypothetical protein